MATSTELKSRLRKFLADPKAEDEFRFWFASLLSQKNDPETEILAHAIDSAFSDAADGQCSGAELRAILNDLAAPEVSSQKPSFIPSAVFRNILLSGTANQSIPFSASGSCLPESKPDARVEASLVTTWSYARG